MFLINVLCLDTACEFSVVKLLTWWQQDDAGNAIEENSIVFCLTGMS